MYTRFFVDYTNIPKLSPHICGRRECPPGWHIEHTEQNDPDRYLLHFVVKGSGTFQKNGITHPIRAGDLFICRSGESAKYTASIDDPWDYVWVGFHGASEFAPLLRQDVIHIPSATRLFVHMVNSKEETVKEWAVCGLLYQFFSLLASTQKEHTPGKSCINQAIRYIEENYSCDLRVNDLADRLGLSRSYFSRSFRHQTGQSPQDFIITCRMEKAAQLLTETELPQKEIARQVGYPDVYAFSRMFKREYGISPGRYKTSNRTPVAAKGE